MEKRGGFLRAVKGSCIIASKIKEGMIQKCMNF